MGTLGTPLMGTDPKDWKWQQVAEVGHFRGHQSGPFELNAKVFDEIIRNFKADGLPIPWDFEHASEQDPTSGSIPVNGSPAQGWVHDLVNRGAAGLWALVEWGDQAKEYIKSGKYLFCSPAIVFQSKDRRTGAPVGARLTSIALTGSPFLPSMERLAAKHHEGAITAGAVQLDFLESSLRQPHEFMPGIRAGLRLSDVATHADCSDKLAQLREACSMADASGMHEGVDLRGTYLSQLADATGMSAAASPADILDAVEEMIDAAMARHIVQDHGGAASASMTLQHTETTPEDTPMSQADIDALAAARAKAVTLETEVTTLSTKATTLNSQVTTLTQRAETAEGEIKAVGVLLTLKSGETLAQGIKRVVDENAALLTAKTQREEADVIADVDRAFDDYKDERKLAESFKATMLTHRRSSPESFAASYLPKTNEMRKLLTSVVPPDPRPKPKGKDGKPVVVQSHTALTAKLMGEKKLSWGAAQEEATRIMREEHAAETAGQ